MVLSKTSRDVPLCLDKTAHSLTVDHAAPPFFFYVILTDEVETITDKLSLSHQFNQWLNLDI